MPSLMPSLMPGTSGFGAYAKDASAGHSSAEELEVAGDQIAGRLVEELELELSKGVGEREMQTAEHVESVCKAHRATGCHGSLTGLPTMMKQSHAAHSGQMGSTRVSAESAGS